MPNPRHQPPSIIDSAPEDKEDKGALPSETRRNQLFQGIREQKDDSGARHPVLRLTPLREQRRPRPINTQQLSSFQQTGCEDEQRGNTLRAAITNPAQERSRNQTPNSLPDNVARRSRRR